MLIKVKAETLSMKSMTGGGPSYAVRGYTGGRPGGQYGIRC